MIASLQGKIEALGSDWAIISVAGIGFQVYMPTSTLASLSAVGEEVKLYTYLQIREDSAALYGFASADELALFQTLISVSGLGPRLALAMLSAMDVEKLTIGIATGSAELLTEIPGIGKKMASRLILELKDKIGAGRVPVPTSQVAAENADIIAALTALGYSTTEATRAVATLPATDLTLEEKVKLALQYFGGK
ncbi:MAG: Holliday junction branch migration protein RuvA [Dehalococcoidia bacterium]|nr:MAG: Holliday junction branch migration protein RuvA [Dehalococcoidia bacterium]